MNPNIRIKIGTILTALLLTLLTTHSTQAGTLWFPHAAAGGIWETEICIINSDGTNRLTGTLYARGSDGREIETKSVDLAADARVEMTIGIDFSSPEAITYLALETESENMAGYTRFYVNGRYSVAIPAVSEVNSGVIHVPHIASDSGWWTGISLVNTTASSKTAVIEFNDESSASISIGANAHDAFTVADVFGGQTPDGVESAAISDADGIIGLALFGSREGTGMNYLSGILLNSAATGSIYYPHVASDNTWWTGIVAYNPGDADVDLAITPYASDGTSLGVLYETLNPLGKYIGTTADLNLPAQAAWFEIESTGSITGFELFGTHDGKQLAGYTGVNIS